MERRTAPTRHGRRGHLRASRVQKKSLALIYEIGEGTYRSGEYSDELRDYDVEAEGLPVKLTRLPEGLRFVDVETDLSGMERVSDGRALTPFLPQGYAIPTMIHLEDDDDQEYTIEIHPLLGRAEVLDGRKELE